MDETSAFNLHPRRLLAEQEESVRPSKRSRENRPLCSAKLGRNPARQLRVPACVSTIYPARVASNFRGTGGVVPFWPPTFSTGSNRVDVSKLATDRWSPRGCVSCEHEFRAEVRALCVVSRVFPPTAHRKRENFAEEQSARKGSRLQRQCASTLVERRSLHLVLGYLDIIQRFTS